MGAILLRLLQAVSFMGILKSVNLLFQCFALEKFQTDLEEILFKIKRLKSSAPGKLKFFPAIFQLNPIESARLLRSTYTLSEEMSGLPHSHPYDSS